MFFDRSERAKRAKERKAELKELKKTMLSGGCDKARVTAHLKEFDDALDAGGAARDDYENARGHLENARGAIRKLLDCMAESPVSEVKERLKNLVAELGEVYHDCSIREDDLDFRSTMTSLKQMVEEYADSTAKAQTVAGNTFASILLRSELENVAAVLDDAAGWGAPDFFALGYYLGHEERASLKEMENEQRNTYVAAYCKEHFLNAFMEECAKAGVTERVQGMVKRYIC